MPEVYRSSRKTSLDFPFNSDSSNFQFILCDKGKVTIEQFDDPLNHQKPIIIEPKDCFICSDSANIITEYRIQDIPHDSPYFVPEDCRCSSKLNKLAVMGHRLYKDKSIALPSNIAKHIERELSVGKKEAEAAGFFISPSPTGSVKDEYKHKVQFEYLVDVYKKAYIYKELDEKRLSSESQLPVDCFGYYGYSKEKCAYAVKLIAPDIQKK